MIYIHKIKYIFKYFSICKHIFNIKIFRKILSIFFLKFKVLNNFQKKIFFIKKLIKISKLSYFFKKKIIYIMIQIFQNSINLIFILLIVYHCNYYK
ncbi:hypothetical protein [Candidatus Carsonella ruddii]|uniref:hypothetical protein n=1 Tax=Carsonella ruddii TaxID=114186 RepID=UPI0004B3A161|nr:hypothetical protein [Candidatus Carsonella ruddii]